jgi:hypothetical protein
MMFRPIAAGFIATHLLAACSSAQVAGPANSSGASRPPAAAAKTVTRPKQRTGDQPRQLQVETLKVPGEVAGLFAPPLKCDGDGNLFMRLDAEGVPGIRKLSQKGERLATAQVSAADIKFNRATYFSLAPDGDIYQIILAWEHARYVFVYKTDGTVKSEIKLQPGFFFSPQQLAVFPSGNLSWLARN